MIFVGVDGLGGPAGGIRKVMDGVLAATFVYPLCVDKAVEIGLRMLREPGFRPEKEYVARFPHGDARERRRDVPALYGGRTVISGAHESSRFSWPLRSCRWQP